MCTTYAGCANSAQKAKESRSSKPAHLNAPVSKTDPERIKLTLQEQRLKCAQLEQALFEMRVELEKSSMEIDDVHMLRQGCLRLFCPCDMSQEFKPV